MKRKKDINIFEDGKETRDFVYITDVVSATILGLENPAADGEVFNVGTGEATDVITVADELIKNYDAETKVTISGNYRLGDIRHNYADLTKIKAILGFSPKFDFKKGIGKFAEWVNIQEIQESKYDQSISEMKNRGLFK